MVKLFKLHKFFGLAAGLVLLILGISGFFLDHKQWSFLYTTTFSNLPDSATEADKKLFDAYWIDSSNNAHRIVGGKRGIFETFDGGDSFKKMSDLQCSGIRADSNGVYMATSDGVYQLINGSWNNLSLKGRYVTSISISNKNITAVIQKHSLVQIQRESGIILAESIVEMDQSQLQDSIKLSRFVRDLHYGRGLLEGDVSLFINDYGAIVVSLLAMSGYLVWLLIRKRSLPKISRKLIRWHANWFAVLALIPLSILAVTGIFLDHSGGLAKFMRSVTIPNTVLPPVYSTLKHDIWSVDFDDETYRIGNRYGVYKSRDLKKWEQESKGFAFRMIRKEDILYVSGMGAPNRTYDGNWHMLRGAPHMFRDVVEADDSIKFFSTHKSSFKIPKFEDATLYAFILTLHDGTFFTPLWVWINDFAAISLLILGITGTVRWQYKKRIRRF